MRRVEILALAVATTLLMGGSVPTTLQRSTIQNELEELTKRGLTYRFINQTTIEIKERVARRSGAFFFLHYRHFVSESLVF